MKALIKNIKVTERIRKEITKIDELAADIRINGLINPITVMSVGDDEFRLLAGLRRLKAVESMGLVEIDVNIVSPSNAEMELRIEISENEQREDFTFSEKMDFARLLEEIEKAEAKERMLSGKRADDPVDDRPQGHGKSRDIVGSKINMSGRQYDRAKYIAEKAPKEIIEELDKGERSINKTYEELRSKEKAEKASVEIADEDTHEENEPDDTAETSDSGKTANKTKEKSVKASKTAAAYKSSATPNMAGLLSKADEEAIERNNRFHSLPPEEKITELQRQLKEARARACTAEADLARLKELRHNDVYHRDGIIDNLQARLEKAEARVQELERLYCPDSVSKGSQSNEVIPLHENYL